MADQLDYKIVRVEEGFNSRAIQKLNAEVDNGYFPVKILENYGDDNVTTLLMSQGQSIVQQPEPDSANSHIAITDNTTSRDYVIIDLSDTTNYPHNNTGFLNLENMILDIDSGGNADYIVTLGFLANVDGTNGDFHEIYKLSGTKTKGATKQLSAEFFPNGGKLIPERWISSTVTTSAAFANTNTLRSTLDPTSATVNPDSGDLVLRVTRFDTGSINFSFSFSYHSKI